MDNWISLGDLLKPGVYALMWRGKFTYIGKSKCLLVALAAHRAVLSGPRLPEWFPTKRVQFDDIKIIPCAADRAARLLPALIDMHKPQHNLHVRPALPLPTFQAPDRPAPTITRRI